MSKRTHKRTTKRALRFQYVGAAGVGGFRIAHPQRDSVVAAMVAEFGEERAEALLRGAEDERVSFIAHLWNKKILVPDALTELWQSVETRRTQQEAETAKAFDSEHGKTLMPKPLSPAEGEERRREWEEARAEGRVTSGASLEPEFDPCFRPETWPWEAADEPGTGKVLSGAPARRYVVDLALRSDAWELLVNRVPEFSVGGDGGSEPAQLEAVFAQRCEALASLLSAFGWPAVTGSDAVLHDAAELTDTSDGRAWLRTGYEFLKAVEYRIEWLTEEVPILAALHAAIEETQLLWLDGVQTPADGNYRVHWMATEARKIHAIRGLRKMGVATASGENLREKLQAQGQDLPQGLGEELDDWVTLRDLREAEGMRLLHIATVFGHWIGEHQERLRGEWGATFEACLTVVQSLLFESQASQEDDAPELIEEGLADLQVHLASLGVVEAEDEEGRVFGVDALRMDAPDLLDAVAAWRTKLTGTDPRESPDAYQCWGMLGFIERSLTEERFGQVVAELTAEPKTCKGEGLATEGRETEEILEEAAPPSRPPVLRDFAKATLDDLVDAFVPEVPQAVIDRLEGLIRGAQESPPEDKVGFVARVNRMLTAQALRLQVEGEENLGRLTVKEGLIRLAVAGRGQQRFRGRQIRVVRVPEDYGLKSRKASPSASPAEP